MKKQIRHGVFETNSSSTHSLTICSKEEFEAWVKGELLYRKYTYREQKQFITPEEAWQELESEIHRYYPEVDGPKHSGFLEAAAESDIYGYKEYWLSVDLETFENSYTTKSGDGIVAFGYYGYN